jgi:hypothetical protein
MPRTLAILAFALLAACKVVPASPDGQRQTLSTTDVTGALGDTVRIDIHKAAGFDEGRFVVRFDSLEADSRCPADAMCVWQGDAAARFTLEAASGRAGTTLHTGIEPKQLEFAGYVLQLVNVEPYPGTYDRSRPAPPPVAVVIVKRG